MMKRISYDQTEKREKADQSGMCGECDSVYIEETGRKFSTRIKTHAKSIAKRGEKSLL